MAEYKIIETEAQVCLECGDTINYGRTDKKFCCEQCRSRHYYKNSRSSRMFKRKILKQLETNHAILENILNSGLSSAEITDLLVCGFSPEAATSFRKVRGKMEYACFDIKYIMTPSRISSISKIQNVSLPLQFGMEMKNL